LALGDYGVDLDDERDPAEPAPPPAAPPPALLTLLIDRVTATLVAGGDQASFAAAEIAAALSDVAPSPPPTAELFLTPCRSPRGALSGTDWLLGLHAPAGATWGRFTAALGGPLVDAARELAKTEESNFPAVERLDLSFAPSAALADLCLHPPLRRRALALTSWPDGAAAPVTVADLELCADPTASDPLTLRTRELRQPVAPSALSRVRSTTAPGWYQLLVGWSLCRQHTPWALALGPLGDLARLPRIAIDGFVVAPGSWRIPPAAGDRGRAALDRKALARWRRESAVPRLVQVGHEDQLLPVDLDDADAVSDLAGNQRVWEIWPPPARGLDRNGRRLEAVIALCDRPDRSEGAEHNHAAIATAQLGAILPPHTAPAAAGWKTFKLFGVEARQDALLVGIVAPLIGDALAAAEIDAWFFIRYVDGPGRRAHLRLRTHAATRTGEVAFAQRLELALRPARADARVVTVETSEYHPEYARFQGPENLTATLRIFQFDSQLACALLETAANEVFDGVELLVGSMDSLATGLGFTLAERHALARQRRDASAGPGADPEQKRADDAEYRVCARRLREQLDGRANDVASRLLAKHAERVAAAATPLPIPTRKALLPTFLHLAAVRLCGLDSDRERRAYLLWERTLEGLLATRPEAAQHGRG
ncbi:MAG TPA: thiopeptide-type bacteriocin biosynthesis protein, partial [Polyangia bacterium]|nr:thiopeptide-type bacteriocin biosynthesis protein [Polyangia bacterium]